MTKKPMSSRPALRLMSAMIAASRGDMVPSAWVASDSGTAFSLSTAGVRTRSPQYSVAIAATRATSQVMP
jgi:hypothetical protein